jgi:hypothetical protein
MPKQPGFPWNMPDACCGGQCGVLGEHDAARARLGVGDRLDAGSAQPFQQPAQVGVADGANHVGRAAVERVERAVPQAELRRALPLRLVAVRVEDLPGHGQGSFGTEAARTQAFPVAGPMLDAPGPGDPPGCRQWVLPVGSGADGIDQDGGQQIVAPGGDGDGDVRTGRFIRLGRPPYPARSQGSVITGAEQARIDELVQVEGGQLARYPGTGGCLLAADRPVRGSDEGVQAPAHLLGEHSKRGQRGIARVAGTSHPNPINTNVWFW